MARIVEAIRKKREQATGVNESFTLLAQQEDVENVEGVRPEGVYPGFRLL